MVKLSYEDKKEIVRLYNEEHCGSPTIAQKFNVATSTIKRIVRKYNLHGEKSLIKNKNRVFSPSLKLEIITRAMSGETKKGLGVEYFIQESHIYSCLKKIASLGSTKNTATNKEKTIVIEELRLTYPLKILLKVVEISKSSYYYVLKSISKGDKDIENKTKIKEIFDDHKGRYGYRRISLEIRNQGYKINHKKVKRLMKVMGLYGITPKAKYKSYKGDMNGTVPNLLLEKIVDEENHTTKYKQNFTTTACNQIWTTDVSKFKIKAGKLYLSPILDAHNDEIISYDISVSPNYAQITNMLNNAFNRFDDLTGLIFQSDQGWQYQMQHYHKILKDKGIVQSMSRKGNCMDNGIMENFFGKMKNEMFYGHEYEFETLDQLKAAMEEYIIYYNEKRI